MSRIQFASKIVAELRPATLLDVGCREAELADHLPDGTTYAGCDLFPDKRGLVKYHGDISTIDIPEQFDAVIALDVLEHLERPSSTFDRLADVTRKHLIVSFPNCYDLKSRFRFLMGGPLGGKYLFDESEPLDRHRWLMNRKEIVAFYEAKSRKHNMKITVIDMKYGAGGHKTLSGTAGRFASMLLARNLATATVYGVFERTSI